MPARRSSKRTTAAGFTLVEVLLALGLTAVLLALVCMAIHLYLTKVDAGGTEVRRVELARNLLQSIAADLQGAVPFVQDGGPGGGPRAVASSSGVGGTGAPDDTAAGQESVTSETAPAIEPRAQPGLYGNQFELQIDVDRLPKLDQMERLLTATEPGFIQQSKTIATVAYFVAGTVPATGDRGVAGNGGAAEAATAGGGLVRRALNRAVARWAVDNGASDILSDADQLLAPEVSAIEFRYFDGSEWNTSWDSQDRGGLPIAVEIAIALRPLSETGAEEAIPQGSLLPDATGGGGTFEENLIYRLLVYLPAARPAPAGGSTASAGGA